MSIFLLYLLHNMSEINSLLLYDIPNIDVFYNILNTNHGLVILKFTASWCYPCKVIENDVKELFKKMPSNVQTIVIDIDRSLEFYTFLKKKRVLNGVPTMLCYNKGNTSFIPDDYVVGASKEKIESFGERCIQNALKIS
jgi:thioredoxin 1